MWKKIFSPVAMMLFIYVPYIICALYAYNETGLVLFLIAFLLSITGAAFCLAILRKNKDAYPQGKLLSAYLQGEASAGGADCLQGEASDGAANAAGRKRYLIASGICALIMAGGAALVEYFTSGGFTLNYIFITSIPVVYNIMGVAYLMTEDGKGNLLGYIAGVLAAPFVLYFTISVSVITQFESVLIILLVFGYYAVVFMLANIFYIFLKRNGKIIAKTNVTRNFYIVTAALGLFLPLTGLLINQAFFRSGGGIFGDFSYPVFYIIAAVNGCLLLIPPVKNQRLRLLVFFLRAVGFTYVLYFCAAFLPALPYGLIGIVIILGLYVFAPYFLCIWQGRILLNDWLALKERFDKTAVSIVFILGIAAIPAVLFAVAHNDRINLQKAIAYVADNPDEKYEEVDANALARTLKFAGGTYGIPKGGDFLKYGFAGGEIPILSNLYAGYLMDGKILSRPNVDFLNNIFLDEKINTQTIQTAPVHSTGFTSRVEAETVYDESIDAYRTWVHLELQNSETSLAEYVTSFDLPEGVFISDYYLYVGGEKKMGLITDERAALFVYNRIVSQSRDPGILHYISEDTLELRVFPFSPYEVRRTGFELLHKQSFDLMIDGELITVKGDDGFMEFSASGAALLSARAIDLLPVLERTPCFNFIIDCSKDSNVESLKSMVREYADKIGVTEANVYFTTYKTEKAKLKNMDDVEIKRKGGFNLGLAVRTALNENKPGEFPVIIVATDDVRLSYAAMPLNTKSGLYPESPYYYVLNDGLCLTRYRFSDNTMQNVTGMAAYEPVFSHAVLYNGAAVEKDGKSHIVITGRGEAELSDNQFENAVLIKARSIKNKRNNEPNAAENVNNSIKAGILSENTAFIVVETLEQEKEILEMQEKLLNGTGIEAKSEKNMSEPPLFAALLTAVVLYAALAKSPAAELSKS